MVKSINLAIIGTGVVGSSFLNQLSQITSSQIKFNVILIAKSNKSLISQNYNPIDLQNWKSEIDTSSSKNLSIDELISYLSGSNYPVILIDNTSDSNIASNYYKLTSNGISIATPNKKAFSNDLQTWNQLINNVDSKGLIYHEATVGAGLPIIGTINDLIATGDQIEKIEGIFSGTLSYIFNEFSTIESNDKKFSDVVKIAKDLGYTEPDPRDDLNGLDVARKVTILSRLSGLLVESPTSFPVHSLIPKDLESIETSQEFLTKLSNYDYQLQNLKDEASKESKVLRFIGKIDLIAGKTSVEIAKYDYSHPFASLKGSDNVISIKTKRYQNPLIIQGAGAGSEVTAAGVLADTIKIAQRL
ncbi:hypothetical protein WICMUC_000376 [Wickerhamomyces mucosus]|uniref:Homoserine dehydrogenase n=1 Tax=Wickerhamomyces mucosus TaxID=1378264 RepID=A0A9P8PZY3_9ASCO|nr:hypothetical protein WICMUC_000376 [Wickerhamomyces mucosus]